MKNYFLSLCLLPAVLGLPLSLNVNSVETVEAEIQAIYDGSKNIPGFTVAVVADTGIIYEGAFGYADTDKELPYTTETVQNIGSISKTFIACALMHAVSDGKVELDTDINQYLPFKVVNPHRPEAVITLRHLATHTSTIKDRGLLYLRSYNKGWVPEMSMGEYLKESLSPDGKWYAKGNFKDVAPGELYEYTNIGATLAAYIVEVITETPFDEYSVKHTLKPIGMDHSGWAMDKVDESKHASVYSPRGKKKRDYTLTTYPDGGMRTTGHDMALYLREIIRGHSHQSDLFEPEIWDQMFAAQFDTAALPLEISTGEPNSGIFWAYRNDGTIGHSGSDPGITTLMYFNPEKRVGKLIFTNTEFSGSNRAYFVQVWRKLNELM